ncbi:MAG: hypothetical protein J2P30_16885 [Actinobacteria bacterium]|nr:hypothetical protein [Actinomycetota bacterium]
MSDEAPVPGELAVGDHLADANRDHVTGAAANLGIINARLALAGRPALTGVLKSGSTPRQFALEPGSTKLLVVDTGSGQAGAYQIAQLP